jgi:hypothetical protein
MKKTIIMILAAMLFIVSLASAFSGLGSGNSTDPYQITNCTQLQEATGSDYYLVMNDIDCSDTLNWNVGAGFIPVTLSSGYFDGGNNTISDLYINKPDTDGAGLFMGSGYLKNVFLENVNVTGRNYVGALAGGGSGSDGFGGTIDHCYSTGSIISSANTVGGLVGNNNAAINNSYSRATVTANGVVGGLVGNNYGTISSSYAAGLVNDGNEASYVGGLLGFNNGGTVNSDTYWCIDLSGQDVSDGGTGKTISEMRTMSTFSGWAFGTTWYIDEGFSLPNFEIRCMSDATCSECSKCSSGSCVFENSSEDVKNDCTLGNWSQYDICKESRTLDYCDGAGSCQIEYENVSYGTDPYNQCDIGPFCQNQYDYFSGSGNCDGIGSCEGNISNVSDGNVCINTTDYDVAPTIDVNCGTWSDCIEGNISAEEYYVGYTNDGTGMCSDANWQLTGSFWNVSSPGYNIAVTEHADTCQEIDCAGSGIISVNMTGDCTLTAGLTTAMNGITIDCQGYQLIPTGTITINNPGVVIKNCVFDSQDFSAYPLFSIAVSGASLYLYNDTFNALTLAGGNFIINPGADYTQVLSIDSSSFSNIIIPVSGYYPDFYGSLINIDKSYGLSITNTRFENIDGQIIHAYNLGEGIIMRNNDFINTTSMGVTRETDFGYGESFTIAFANLGISDPSIGFQITGNNFTGFGMFFSEEARPDYPGVFGCGGTSTLNITNNYFRQARNGLGQAMFYFAGNGMIDWCPDNIFNDNTVYVDEEINMSIMQETDIPGCIERNNKIIFKNGWKYMWNTYGLSAGTGKSPSYAYSIPGGTCSQIIIEDNDGLGYVITNPMNLPPGYPGGAINILIRNNNFTYLGLAQAYNQYQPINFEAYNNNFIDAYIGIIRAGIYDNDMNYSVHNNFVNFTRFMPGLGGCSFTGTKGGALTTAIINTDVYDNTFICPQWTFSVRNTSHATGDYVYLLNWHDNIYDIPLMTISPSALNPATYTIYPVKLGSLTTTEPWINIPRHTLNSTAAYPMLLDGEGLMALDAVEIPFLYSINLTGMIFNARPKISTFYPGTLFNNTINYTVLQNYSVSNIGSSYTINVTQEIMSGSSTDWEITIVNQSAPTSTDFSDYRFSGDAAFDGDMDSSVYLTSSGTAYGYFTWETTHPSTPVALDIYMKDNNGIYTRRVGLTTNYPYGNGTLNGRVQMYWSGGSTYRIYVAIQNPTTLSWNNWVQDTTSASQLYEIWAKWIYQEEVPANITTQLNLTKGASKKTGVCSQQGLSSLCSFTTTSSADSGLWNGTGLYTDAYGSLPFSSAGILLAYTASTGGGGAYVAPRESPPNLTATVIPPAQPWWSTFLAPEIQTFFFQAPKTNVTIPNTTTMPETPTAEKNVTHEAIKIGAVSIPRPTPTKQNQTIAIIVLAGAAGWLLFGKTITTSIRKRKR